MYSLFDTRKIYHFCPATFIKHAQKIGLDERWIFVKLAKYSLSEPVQIISPHYGQCNGHLIFPEYCQEK